MNISVRWLNRYLEPGDVSAAEAEEALTAAGFPIESATPLEGGDTLLDVEVTSNRGDCLSHVGCAREIAAATGRKLKYPEGYTRETGCVTPNPTGAPPRRPVSQSGSLDKLIRIDNRVIEGGECPLFTARVVKGVKVGPSPRWMVEALAAVGQRSINNVVDVTNYVQFELGQPSHVFDLAGIAKNSEGVPTLAVRRAAKGETLTLLDGKKITLAGDELVVADATGPISLAGVMGGGGYAAEVTDKTVDVLLEAATWDPVAVRRAARRFNLRTDASYRFERIVDARTIDAAARRAAQLLVEVTGGQLVDGSASAGAPLAPATTIELRLPRVAAILGRDMPREEVTRILTAHGVRIAPSNNNDDTLACTVPAWRPDLTREIDLIEELARTAGLDKVAVHEKIPSRIAAPQANERAMRELGSALTGMGFYETVTFSFLSMPEARPFVAKGTSELTVSNEKRKAEPVLRPSVTPSLLKCRKANQDAGAALNLSGGIRLFETASVYAERVDERPTERRVLSLLADVTPIPGAGSKASEQLQATIRLLRGTLETLAKTLGGPHARIELRPTTPLFAAAEASASAEVLLHSPASTLAGASGSLSPEKPGTRTPPPQPGTRLLGWLAPIAPKVQSQFGLEHAVVAAEVELDPLIAMFPPKVLVEALPAYPAIQRDLSLIVDEATPWAAVESFVKGQKPALMESLSFVTAYRGKPLDAGKKSVTLRVLFRDPARTLTHDEVTPQMDRLVDAARRELGADVRTV